VVQLEDERPVGLTAIIAGRMHFIRHVGDDVPVLLHVGGPGMWAGEVAIVDGVSMVTWVAQTALTVLILPAAEFSRMVAEQPRCFPHFARLVYDRFRTLVRFHAEAQGLSPDNRLRLRLAGLAELRRLDIAVGDPGVTLEITQGEVARLVGMSRQRVNARLQVLRREGWLALERGRLRLSDPAGLRASALTRRSVATPDA
jgi:CRP/FNR family transcriptional regulator, cyclic AMP receptor protein